MQFNFINQVKITGEEEMYYHSKWARLVKERDGWRCANEEKSPHLNHELYELNAHHILPKKLGGKNTLGNGITFCRACHAAEHPEYQQKFLTTFQLLFLHLKDKIRALVGLPKDAYYHSILYFLTGKIKFRPLQKEIIKKIIEGKKHVFVVMPTGFGKSILYQIPGVVANKPSLVISPLKALQLDQVMSLLRKHVSATFINSDLDESEVTARLSQIRNGFIPFVFVHPKQLLSFNKKEQAINVKLHKPLTQIGFDYLVIDEVHVVKSQGLSFVKEYFHLNKLRDIYHDPQLILLTATASQESRELIYDRLGVTKNDIAEFVGNFIRPEITLEIYHVSNFESTLKKGWRDKKGRSNSAKTIFNKDDKLRELLANKPEGKTIIFATTTKQVDELHEKLVNWGIRASKYHSKLNDREKYFKEFIGRGDKASEIMVATSAFGMGVDIPNIHQVIHYSMPFGIVDYYQQIGRAGRDGKQSVAQLLVDAHNSTGMIDYINRMSLENEADPEVRELLQKTQQEEKQALLDYIHTDDNRWQFIQNHFGQPTQKKASIWPLMILILIGWAFWWIAWRL